MLSFLRSSYLSLPQEPGIYLFLDKNNEVLYVGKAKDLKKRVSSYFTKDSLLLDKTGIMVSKIAKIQAIPVQSEIESLLLEANYIKKFSPLYNVRLTDGKSYPLIRITKDELCPKVLIARRQDNNRSLYFGPYPNVSAMKMVLRTIRRIFPYESVVNHPKKICLYYHLNLCPCVEAINSKEAIKEYKRNIKHIIQFLNGKIGEVLKELEEERDEKSKNEEFEKAHLIQKQIDAIKLITNNVRAPFEYELNPNLKSDLRAQELLELQDHLKMVEVNVSNLSRIECFDISNIQGHFATGSMVVFINGEKDTSFYRRFKILLPTNAEPNDFASMEEVISRRLKHKEWGYPDLLIVDGGKGQISSALKVLLRLNISLPVIGLAKREEIIITSDFREIRLPKSSKALHLMQRIRDEAHRFAITYHRKLRSQNFLKKI